MYYVWLRSSVELCPEKLIWASSVSMVGSLHPLHVGSRETPSRPHAERSCRKEVGSTPWVVLWGLPACLTSVAGPERRLGFGFLNIEYSRYI